MKLVLNVMICICALCTCVCLSSCSTPNSARDYASVAAICCQSKQYQKAIDYASKAIRLDAKDGGAYGIRGGAYFELKQYQKAVDDFSKTIELTKSLYADSGESAKDKVLRSLVGDSEDNILAEIYYSRGQAYEKLGKHDLAQSDLAQAKKMGYGPAQE